MQILYNSVERFFTNQAKKQTDKINNVCWLLDLMQI